MRDLICSAIAFLIVATVANAQTTAPVPDEAGTGVYVGDEMLRDYRPVSTLVTKVTRVERARFPAIDIHCHWNVDQNPQRMLAAMDSLGISHAVNLSGGTGETFEKLIDTFHAADRERFIIFVNLDFKDIDMPGWGDRSAAWLDHAKSRGAKGLKLFKSFGVSIRDSAGRLIAVDDARLDPVWQKCAEIGFPVLIHSADPVAFFQPVDQTNERWMQLRRNPGWSFVGGDVPGWQALVDARNRVVAKHRQTQFIIAHMAEGAHDYATLSRWLDENPNMSIDLSARENEIGRQPFASRKFFIKYADRILFGTDRYPGRIDQPRNRVYYRILETDDEYFDYYEHPFAPMGEWKVYGLSLPDEVLEKIYRGNAKRLLRME